MLSRHKTKGLARWKPLLALPLAAALVLVFAEARTVVKEGPAVIAGQSAAVPSSQDPSEEEMVKALKEKFHKLEQMKQQNQEAIAKLKAKLEEAPDAAAKEEIMAKLKEQKVLSLQLAVKERTLMMKKIEYALTKESDAAKKADLEKKLEQVRAEAEEYEKKVEVARKAEPGLEKEKAAAEKKIEKK